MKGKEINIDQPEEFFTSEVLRKGFSMFRRNLVEFNGKERSVHHFFVGGRRKEEVTLNLSKEKIVNYSCTCDVLRCAHLCAAVLFLRKENYSSEENKFALSDINEKIYKGQEAAFSESGLKYSLNNALDFSEKIEPYSRKIIFLLGSVICFLRGKNQKITEDDLKRLFALLTHMRIKKEHSDFLRFTVKESLKSQRKFESEVWFYLLPFLSRFQNYLIAEELKSLFLKRTSKPVFPGNVDKKEVGMNYLSSGSKNRKDNQSAECFIANAMIAFAEWRIKKAFEILEKGYEVLKRSNSVSLGAYVQFIIDKSVEYEKKSLEIKFLKEYFLIEPFISSSVFQRLSVLLSKQERASFYEDIVSGLRNKRETQDKIFEILFHEKRWSDLISEIRRSSGKFNLLNKVALEMLPEINEDLLKVYPDFVVNAINSSGDGHYRTFIFESFRKFTIHIPHKRRVVLVNEIIDKLGGKHHLAEGFLKTLNPPA